ncbi:MAG: protein translocase subunit SecD [Calditrichia bacterium]|nr:protein translocase subunit SecD [Calditrichia bacterium]
MQSSTTMKLFLILAVFALSLYLLYPTYKLSQMSDAEKESLEIEDRNAIIDLKSKSVNLGLDLQGGMHVILEVDVKELLYQLAKNKNEAFTEALDETAIEIQDSDENFITVFNRNLKDRGSRLVRYYGSRELSSEDDVISYLRDQTSETVTRAKEILTNRVDEFGVSEPIIQQQGDNRIIIELAGITDPTRVRQLIGKTAKLEFRLLKDREILLAVAEKMHEYVQSQIAPMDTTEEEVDDEGAEADTSVSLDELFGSEDSQEAAVDTSGKEEDELFEQDLFFLHPSSQRTLLIPIEKKGKFREFLTLEDIQKIIQDEAGDVEFLWGSKAEYEDQFIEVFLVNTRSELTGETIMEADPRAGSQMDPTSIGKYEVSFTLNDDGTRIFSRVTGANIKKRLAVVLDRQVYLAPEIQVKIRDGRSRITGLNTMEEAQDLSIILRAGALPAPVRIIEERTVGPSLGLDSILSGSRSALYGMILVAIFMLIYYKFSGALANMALALNIIFIMAVMAYFNATLTLPGIAGIILTIGIAVDANVLIFERIREELQKGKTTKSAIDQGYGNALSAILDANVTTFIASVVLYTFGSGPIKGFALTLMIGIVASMFTAIVVTRVVFDYAVSKWSIKKLSI